MPPMPYYLEKGPMFSVVEDYLNADTARAVDTLRELRKESDDPTYVELWELDAFGVDQSLRQAAAIVRGGLPGQVAGDGSRPIGDDVGQLQR